MKRFLTALVVALGLSVPIIPAQADEMTAQDAAEYLSKSIVQVSDKASGDPFCTAWKVAPKVYATAGHCATDGEIFLNAEDFDWAKVKAVTVGIGEKEANDKPKDWALLHTMTDLEDVVPLPLACEVELNVGLPIAYLGYGYPAVPYLGVGYIASMDIEKARGNAAEIALSTHVAGGASGAPVVELDGGKVIGIVTELVPSPRVGVIGTGMEGIVEGICDAAQVHTGKTPIEVDIDIDVKTNVNETLGSH